MKINCYAEEIAQGSRVECVAKKGKAGRVWYGLRFIPKSLTPDAPENNSITFWFETAAQRTEFASGAYDTARRGVDRPA